MKNHYLNPATLDFGWELYIGGEETDGEIVNPHNKYIIDVELVQSLPTEYFNRRTGMVYSFEGTHERVGKDDNVGRLDRHVTNFRPVTAESSALTGEEIPGTFNETHVYRSYDIKTNRYHVDKIHDMGTQVGTSNEFYHTSRQYDPDYRFVGILETKGDPKVSPTGEFTRGNFKEDEHLSVTYLYVRLPEMEVGNDLYEMTIETISYPTEIYMYDQVPEHHKATIRNFDRLIEQVEPGQFTKIQYGRDGIEGVLYKHLNPEDVSNYNPQDFFQMRREYWQPVSSEMLSELQPEIIVYRPLEKDPEKPEEPKEPEEPIQPLQPQQLTVESRRGDHEGHTGTWVEIKVYDPNTDTTETEEFFIPDGQNGQDGTDGKDGQDGKDGKDGNTVTVEPNEGEEGAVRRRYCNQSRR